MVTIQERLAQLAPETEERLPWNLTVSEERLLIPFMLRHPEMFEEHMPHIEPGLFNDLACKYIMCHIHAFYVEHNLLPTQELVRDAVARDLTTDTEPRYLDVILEMVQTKGDSKFNVAVYKIINKWVQHRLYAKLYTTDMIEAVQKRGEYEKVRELVEQAEMIQAECPRLLDLAEDYREIFDPKAEDNDHFTTGIPTLDLYLDNGGPKRGQLLVWMAPTGRGKSIMLCQNAVANAAMGRRVLLITMETRAKDLIKRAVANISNQDIFLLTPELEEMQVGKVEAAMGRFRKAGGEVKLLEFEPDLINVDQIAAEVTSIKRRTGFSPDLLVVDYLELLAGRHRTDKIWQQQKAIATELRGLALRLNVGIFTATQTNRDGLMRNEDEKQLGLDSVANSYDKTMAMDYLISINMPSDTVSAVASEIQPGGLQRLMDVNLFIAKNRHGKTETPIKAKLDRSHMRFTRA